MTNAIRARNLVSTILRTLADCDTLTIADINEFDERLFDEWMRETDEDARMTFRFGSMHVDLFRAETRLLSLTTRKEG